MTPKQREMLISFAKDGEATDLCMFDNPISAFAWGNRERVIDACFRRGWLDADGITEKGRRAIGL